MEAIKGFIDMLDWPGIIVGAVIGVIIPVLFNQVQSFFRKNRKKYCLSKSLASSSVYQQTDDGGLKIRVSYNDTEVEGPLSILSIRLRNDGSEDLAFSRRFNYLKLVIDELEVLDVSVSSSIAGVNPAVFLGGEGNYGLKWDLLKVDECFFVRVVAKGEINDLSAIKFEVRADGLNQIKTPEYKVNEVMKPVLLAAAVCAILTFIIVPASLSFVEIMSMRAFMLIVDAFSVLLILVSALLQRIKWMKEQ